MDKSTVDILIFSDNVDTRRAVIDGVGLRAAKDLPNIHWLETATSWGTVQSFRGSKPDVLVLDAEASKVGGMAVARQIINECDDIPPIVLLTARPQDKWLADWSGADVVVQAPYDPLQMQEAISKALRLAL